MRECQGVDWVKKQRLIARRHGSVDGFFTVELLKGIRRVRKGIRGFGLTPKSPHLHF